MDRRYTLGKKIKMNIQTTRLSTIMNRLFVLFAITAIGAVAATNLNFLDADKANVVNSQTPVTPGITVSSPANDTYSQSTIDVTATLPDKAPENYHMFWYVDNGSWNWMGDTGSVNKVKKATIDVSGWKWHLPSTDYTISLVAVDLATGQRTYASVPIHVTADPRPASAAASAAAAQHKAAADAAEAKAKEQAAAQAGAATTQKAAPVTASPAISSNLYVNPVNNASQTAATSSDPTAKRILSRIGSTPSAAWFGGWNGNITADASALAGAAAAQGQTPVMVAYNIPGRDCNSYSAGGAASVGAYQAWIKNFAAGIGTRSAIVILEPDALAQITCLPVADQTARYQLLNFAISTLKANAGTRVYLDAGHAKWIAAGDMSNRLKAGGIAGADGFSLNVSNFATTQENQAYGRTVSGQTGGKHFVIDTSRNGNGSNGEWCNPVGRALGQAPTSQTGDSLTDYYLWIKTPGESDGSCNGAPAAGVWWPSYAVTLGINAGW